MKKKVKYSSDAREQLLSGVQKISKAVKITLGPSGKNVLIRNSNSNQPFATKDGVTVAADMYSKNPIEQMAIEAIQQVANNADSGSGDGTTTATILAEAIFQLGTELQSDETNLIDMKRGIDIAVVKIIEVLKEISTPYKTNERLKQIAMISSNNDKEISDIVIDAFKVAGNQGVVNIKRSKEHKTFLTTIEGMNLDTGYRSRYYINDWENDIVDFDKPYVLITDQKITHVSENLNQLLIHINKEQIPLLIICPDMDSSVSDMLIENKMKNVFKVCVCKTPGFGEEQLEEIHDLATVLGCVPFLEKEAISFDSILLSIDKDSGEATNLHLLLDNIPRSESVIVTKNKLSIKGPYGLEELEYEKIEKAKKYRANLLRNDLEKEVTSYEKSKIQSRISRITDGLAFINIGAISEIEFTEKQHRVTDALYGVKSASEEGIIPGGGTTLMHVSYILKDEIFSNNSSVQLGAYIALQAIKVPFFQILENVGWKLSDEEVDYVCSHFNVGVDARTKTIEKNMIKAGIIDPVKVTRIALENAASIAGMLLTTDCVIVDASVYDKPKQSNMF